MRGGVSLLFFDVYYEDKRKQIKNPWGKKASLCERAPSAFRDPGEGETRRGTFKAGVAP